MEWQVVDECQLQVRLREAVHYHVCDHHLRIFVHHKLWGTTKEPLHRVKPGRCSDQTAIRATHRKLLDVTQSHLATQHDADLGAVALEVLWVVVVGLHGILREVQTSAKESLVVGMCNIHATVEDSPQGSHLGHMPHVLDIGIYVTH